MKTKFYTGWKRSKQARKQRKYRANAHIKLKRKFLSLNLSKELRKKYNKRNLPLRKGDTVKVLTGKFKNNKGKVLETNKKMMVLVDNIQIVKRDGTKINVPISPSKLQIVELLLEDKKRIESLERKTKKESKIQDKKSGEKK